MAVKSAKRLIQTNISTYGDLDNDRFARALLHHRNSVDTESGLSPAMITQGRQFRDFLPTSPSRLALRFKWQQMADLREQTYARRHVIKAEQLDTKSNPLPPLIVGDHVDIQEVRGNMYPSSWVRCSILTTPQVARPVAQREILLGLKFSR